MAIVQSVPAHAEGATGVTITITSTGSGNLLLVAGTMTNTTSTLALTYTGTAQTATSLEHPTGTGDQMQAWYIPNCASGTTAITISRNTGTGQFAGLVVEVSGEATSTPLDQHTSTSSGSSPVSTGTTGTTTQAAELWWACFGDKGVNTGGVAPTYSGLSAGWTADVTTGSTATGVNTNVSIFDATQTVSATGTASASITVANEDNPGTFHNGMGIVATFKAAAGGPAATLVDIIGRGLIPVPRL